MTIKFTTTAKEAKYTVDGRTMHGRSYATEANAKDAIEKAGLSDVRHLMLTVEGRYMPVFIPVPIQGDHSAGATSMALHSGFAVII